MKQVGWYVNKFASRFSFFKLNILFSYKPPIKAAPVGDIPAHTHDDSVKMPHIYGGIPAAAVTNIYPIVRGEDGSFLNISGLVGI